MLRNPSPGLPPLRRPNSLCRSLRSTLTRTLNFASVQEHPSKPRQSLRLHRMSTVLSTISPSIFEAICGTPRERRSAALRGTDLSRPVARPRISNARRFSHYYERCLTRTVQVPLRYVQTGIVRQDVRDPRSTERSSASLSPRRQTISEVRFA